MGIPLRMKIAVGTYMIKQKLLGRKKFPLVLMLEPLFACNLQCVGCGKIQYPPEILKKRLTPETCWKASEECGAPIVAVAGGEPLIHPQIKEIVEGFIQRKKFVILCTNAILLEQNLHKFKPSPYFNFGIHLDGLEKTHDRLTEKGTFQKAVSAIKKAKSEGFCVTTNTTIYEGDDTEEFKNFLDFCTELGVDGMEISPAYAYEKAPQQNVFLKRDAIKNWFRKALMDRRKKKWPLNHSPFYLDFLEGKKDYDCTAWGNPVYSILGWQKPCYLIVDEGYVNSYAELLQSTDWTKYGVKSKNPKCANCMAHAGFEPTAVQDVFDHPIQCLLSMTQSANGSTIK